MLCVIIGGKLQGVEAAYLAAKAGWEITIIDKTPEAPASGLGHRVVTADVQNTTAVNPILKDADLIIPALENPAALAAIVDCARSVGVPLAFDPNAYAISSSKLTSDRLFVKSHIPAPRYWPDCAFPVLAKPSTGSGSSGVQIFNAPAPLRHHIASVTGEWVVQEFLQGPTYSLEVIGRPGNYTPFQVTDLGMDPGYDCNRVIGPTDLDASLVSEFNLMGVSLAEAVALEGIMDVEVILHDHTLKVLEIDARLPSQTPTAVFWSTGLNLLQVLGDLTLSGTVAPFCPTQQMGVVYEHIRVSPGLIEIPGEHIMATAGPLHLHTDFFGADEAITNYVPGAAHWVATLIMAAPDREKALAKSRAVKDRICKETGINRVLDEGPKAIRETNQ
jgi:pyrrolysine biosynthesis protein PylC